MSVKSTRIGITLRNSSAQLGVQHPLAVCVVISLNRVRAALHFVASLQTCNNIIVYNASKTFSIYIVMHVPNAIDVTIAMR